MLAIRGAAPDPKLPILAPVAGPVVRFDALPEDMQVLIADYFEIDGLGKKAIPEQFDTLLVPIECFPDVELADGLSDERGEPYARRMIGESVPPVILVAHHWLDGRHRAWAAREESKRFVAAIDLQGFLPVKTNGNYPTYLASLLRYRAPLDGRLTPEFLATLVEAARAYGWTGDFAEVKHFVDDMHDRVGVPRAEILPYD